MHSYFLQFNGSILEITEVFPCCETSQLDSILNHMYFFRETITDLRQCTYLIIKINSSIAPNNTKSLVIKSSRPVIFAFASRRIKWLISHGAHAAHIAIGLVRRGRAAVAWAHHVWLSARTVNIFGNLVITNMRSHQPRHFFRARQHRLHLNGTLVHCIFSESLGVCCFR